MIVLGIKGACSFVARVEDELIDGKLWGNSSCKVRCSKDVEYSQREGCLIFLWGEVTNISQIKERYGIKDKKGINIILSLYVVLGEAFVNKLEGDFVIVLCDEIEKKVYIFTDTSNTREMFFAAIEGAFIFCDNRRELINHHRFNPVIDREGVKRLFALPFGYLGEFISEIYKITGNEYVIISCDGAEIFEYKFKPKKINKGTFLAEQPENGDVFLYSMLKNFSPKLAIPPHALASIIKKGKITDGHLLFMQNSNSYEELMNEKYDFTGFVKEHNNKLLCELDYFSYETQEDIDRVENFYIYYKLYLQSTTTEIFNLTRYYGVKNETTMFFPYVLKELFVENKEKFFYATSNKLYLAEDIRKVAADMCENRSEPVFRLVNRNKLISAINDVEESYLLFLLRVNKYLEYFNPHIEV